MNPHAEPFRGNPILMTGGLGGIGSNLARRLAACGADEMPVDNLIPEYGDNHFNIDRFEGRERASRTLTAPRCGPSPSPASGEYVMREFPTNRQGLDIGDYYSGFLKIHATRGRDRPSFAPHARLLPRAPRELRFELPCTLASQTRSGGYPNCCVPCPPRDCGVSLPMAVTRRG